MNAVTVQESICDAIAAVQSMSDLECPALSGSTVPARDVKDFKSEVWPIAISIIADSLKIDIPNDENLFFDDATKERLTIDQCVEKILTITKRQKKKKCSQ